MKLHLLMSDSFEAEKSLISSSVEGIKNDTASVNKQCQHDVISNIQVIFICTLLMYNAF